MSKGENFYESTSYQLVLICCVIATLLMSIFAVVNIYELKKFIIPEKLDVEKFLGKLYGHSEMSPRKGTSPMNIVQVTQGNLPSLQSQIKDLDVSFIGNFIVQYQDLLVVYDYANDTIKGAINISPFPVDFFSKLNAHSEMKALKSQNPTGGGVLDSNTLGALAQQSPETYKGAKIGDYVVVYGDQAVIYDYSKDKIIKVFSTQSAQ